MPATSSLRLQHPPALLLAGALAQIATLLATACPRAAHRARLLLEEIAGDDGADGQLRREARSLCEALERDAERKAPLAGAGR